MKVRSRAVVFSAASLILVYILGSLFRFASVATVDYARQTGQPCGTCHVRPEGGGELDATGAAFAQGGYQWPIAEGIKPYTPSNLAKTLRLILGYVHLTVAVIWFGTIFYIHIVVRPQQIMTGIPKTQAILGWIGIATMAATGTGLAVLRHLETGSVFQGSFGAVFIIKLALFGIMVLLAFVATAILSRRMRATPEGQTSGPTSGNRTPETLAASSGEDGARAIFAVNGILYDVTESRLWRRGVHAGQHRAGQDLTEALKSAPHGDEVLQRVPRVGLLRAGPHTTGTQRRRVQRLFLGAAYANLVLSLGILFCVAWWKWGFAWDRRPVPSPHGVAQLSESSAECIACHTENEFMLSQISEWQRSAHAQEQVGCYECHHAEAGDPDAMDHNGYTISVLVTPLDCGECHIRESEEFLASRHAQAGDILDSLDNILGERVEGVAAAVLGCQQCHGAPIEVQADGTLSAASWPNTGIGRINPDGSSGA
ncbi:MAG: hypothetical protein JXA74_11725, partial [Anaerolineae bacterium]|nr:hypothetical protein [Anaerolineae bacterium]